MKELARKEGITISVEKLAKAMGTLPEVVLEIARKYLPNKKIEKGQKIYWTESEITAVLAETPKFKKTSSECEKKNYGEDLRRWWNELDFNTQQTTAGDK